MIDYSKDGILNMKGLKTVYVCSSCGHTSPKWMGKCPSCSEWNTFVEDVISTVPEKEDKASKHTMYALSKNEGATKFENLEIDEYLREETGLSELDRVLGGGLVNGSAVLISGEPGIGKSTLLIQISDAIGKTRRVMYVSGEESSSQIKMRADRLGLKGKNLYLLTENNLDRIFKEIDRVKPDILIVDSIQTVYADNVSSSPGSVTQVKESALSLINKAKGEGISVIMVGHVNKEGGIAGPKVLEHMVDAVIYFEGDRRQTYRIIRAIKNRFGSTNEIGVFEMTERGLVQIPNPSEMLLADRPKNTSGNCAVCIMEGTRPIIAEVQALVSATFFPAPRRTTNGMDYNRMCLVLAVLEKRLGLRFSANDVYINVIGGLEIDDPGTDMATALALISSLTDKVVPDDLVAFGELGLAGECRAVAELERKVNEASRLGFTQAIVPERNYEKLHVDPKMKLIPVKSVYEAIRVLVKADEE